MGRVKKTKGRRDEAHSDGLHWTPLQMSCGCVVEWAWDSQAMPPEVFMEWCVAVMGSPCVWHGAEGGVSVPLDQELVALTMRFGRLYTRRAKPDLRELGISLTRQVREVLKSEPSDVPENYQELMRSRGYDPAETWVQLRMTDILLNLGKVTLTDEMINELLRQ